MKVISIKEVHKKYPPSETEVHTVNGISFDIELSEL